ncbi:MAG: ABC transporter substrate-binding protein [Azospirillum sp.]|nr:ABC transporter substrate-binding protein [Azospirillum sp.]
MRRSAWAVALLASLLPAAVRAEIPILLVVSASARGGAEESRSEERGARGAVDAVNRAGGVLGQPLRLETLDDGCDPARAIRGAKDAVARGFPVVFGHPCSSASLPASLIYQEDGVLMISPTSTASRLTERGLDLIFRVCGRTDKLGAATGAFLAKAFRGQRLAIIHDRSAYGRYIASDVKTALNLNDKREAAYMVTDTTEAGLSTAIAGLRAKQIDVVFVGAQSFSTTSHLLTATATTAWRPTVMVGDWLGANALISVAGGAAEGLLFTAIAGLFDHTQGSNWLDGEDIGQGGHLAHIAVEIWAEAARRAGSVAPRKVAGAMKAGRFKTELGSLGFDSKGDIDGLSYQVYRWAAGQPVAVTQPNPAFPETGPSPP